MHKQNSNWIKCTHATSEWLYHQGDFFYDVENFILEWLDHWYEEGLPEQMEFVGRKRDIKYSVNTGSPTSTATLRTIYLDKFPSFLYGTKPHYFRISNVVEIVERIVDEYIESEETPDVISLSAEDLFEDYLENVYDEGADAFDYRQSRNNAVGLSELQVALDRFCFINAAAIKDLVSNCETYCGIYTSALQIVEAMSDLQYALDTCALLNSDHNWTSVVDNKVRIPIDEDTWLKYIIYYLKDI